MYTHALGCANHVLVIFQFVSTTKLLVAVGFEVS
jgi:hypothetical protein